MARRIQKFLRRPWKDKVATAQFFLRRALAGVPYLPVTIRLRLASDEEIRFRWSYVAPFHDPERRFFDYWGQDAPELRMLWKILKPGMVFLDIGAYHGIYSLVAAKRRLFAIREMIADYGKLYDRFRGVTRALVTSAAPLSGENVAALKESLRAISGGKEVDLNVKLDASIIGGIIVQLGSRMVDGSLKTKLNAIRTRMKEVG